MGFAYFEKHYRLIAANLSKQEVLDADWRAIFKTDYFCNKIIFTSTVKISAIIYLLHSWQSKETTLELFKEKTKALQLHIKWLNTIN